MDEMFDDVLSELDTLGGIHSKAYKKVIDSVIDDYEINHDKTLEERGDRYGKFTTQALISQSMKNRVRSGKSWDSMDYDMKEAIDMILHKVARIVNGDPYYMDSWHDIAGYATLIEKRFSDDTPTI